MHNHCQQHLQRCVHNRETSSQWVKTSENKIQMNITFKNYIICHLTLSEDLLIEIILLNQKLPQAVIPYCTVFGISQELGFSATWAGCQRRWAAGVSPTGIFKLKHSKVLWRGNAGHWEGLFLSCTHFKTCQSHQGPPGVTHFPCCVDAYNNFYFKTQIGPLNKALYPNAKLIRPHWHYTSLD